ncbi:MAG: hypothetical protein HY548_05240 [Elusimicrobia bacterium]|nr:hypothetical protein [Elusimicrobiota bacterium]
MVIFLGWPGIGSSETNGGNVRSSSGDLWGPAKAQKPSADIWESKPSTPVDTSQNPDKYPSLGFNANYSPLTGKFDDDNIRFRESSLVADLRIPVTNALTWSLGAGYREIDQGDGWKVKGATLNVGGRFYFKK